MYLLTVAHLRQRLVSFHLWFPPFPLFPPFPSFPPFPPFLRSSVPPKLHHPTTQSLHRSVSLFLCYFVFLLSFISSPFYLFVSPLFQNSGTPELRYSDTPILRLSGSPVLRNSGVMENSLIFTSSLSLLLLMFFLRFRYQRSQGPCVSRTLVSPSLTRMQIYLSITPLVGIPNLFS